MLTRTVVIVAVLMTLAGLARGADVPADVQVLYFHRTIRCQTCLAMESLTDVIVNERFADALATDGLLGWRVLDLATEDAARFVAEFELDGPALVIVENDAGRRLRWKNLTRIWELIDEPGAFEAYVATEIERYLESLPDKPVAN